MAQLQGLSEEACSYRLLMKHGRCVLAARGERAAASLGWVPGRSLSQGPAPHKMRRIASTPI